jgi:xylose isomerase
MSAAYRFSFGPWNIHEGADVAHKHLANSRTVFLKLVEKVRSFPEDQARKCIAERNYEGLELAVLEHLLGR